ncbi:hypothetical protein PVK06_030275 [Gossypium arboreum]|uniref:Uncharacterized protein n=1 Tax=Gossypium arboreum TaxID=29729 RepID=A0ABR0NMV8_GOSAR|nr:hypothetical protein PVK06_030275 [Gossypium arboreum]
MKFNKNVSVDDMKERISAKMVRHCRRRISKLFYKFPVSTNPIKFTEMELVDDEDVEIMLMWSPAENLTPFGEEHEVQDLCIVVPRAFVDRRLTIRRIHINPNAPPSSENLNPGPHLQIHLVVIETDVDGDDGYDNNDPSNHEVEDDSDLDLDEVLSYIDAEGANDDGNVNVS